MADAHHHATPIAKPIRRAETRPPRRVDKVPEQGVSFLMPGREPHLMLNRRLDGRGAGVWQAADVLAFQRTLGNRATQRAVAHTPHADIQRWPGRKKKKNPVEELKDVQGKLPTLPSGQAKEKKPTDRSGDAKDLLGVGADAIKTPTDALKGFAFAHVKEDADIFAADPKYKVEVGDSGTRADLGFAASVLAPGGSLLSMGGGIASIVQLSRKLKDAKGMKKGEVGLELFGKLVQTGASGAQSGAYTSAFIAGSVKKADSNNAAAGAAAGVSGGIGDFMGALGAVFDMVTGAGKGVMGVIKAVQEKKGDWTTVSEILSNFLAAGKGFLTCANSAISAVNKFLLVVKTGAEFVQAVPFIGGAINIAVQSIDVLIQAIKAVTAGMSLARARKYQLKMKAAAASMTEKAGTKLTTYLGGINRKRFRRAWIPLSAAVITALADLVSIGASILNIVGTATAGAMGAGAAVLAAGYGLAAGAGVAKLGAGAMKPIAMLVRTGKQKIRNAGETNKTVKQVGSKLGINMDKTTTKKLAKLDKNVVRLLTYLTDLKDEQAMNALSENDKAGELAKYTMAYQMVRATGLKPKDLEADDVEAIKDKLRTAMLARE